MPRISTVCLSLRTIREARDDRGRYEFIFRLSCSQMSWYVSTRVRSFRRVVKCCRPGPAIEAHDQGRKSLEDDRLRVDTKVPPRNGVYGSFVL